VPGYLQGANLTIAIYPASFDPIHYGHIDIAKRSALIFDRVIVAVYERPLKNLLFNIDERLQLVEQALRDMPNIEIARYSGLTVEYARQVGAQVIVRGLRVVSDFELEWHMALTNKQLAPDIEVVCFMTSQAYAFLSSSTLREVALLGGDVSSMAPPFVGEALHRKAIERAQDPINQPVPIMSLRD
jgi:pantetheine-phosphate adenylyltransferase